MDKLPTDASHGDRDSDESVAELAARAHFDAARLAESNGQVSAARDHRAFAARVRAALREFDSPRARRTPPTA